MAGYIGSKTVNLSTTGADIAGDADVSGALDVGGAFTSQGIDDNATSTAMTLDGSGNLLVGTTSSDPSAPSINTAGTAFGASGYISITRDGDAPVIINRKSSDGKIADFRKNGVTVGSIGAKDGDMYLGTGDTGLRFHDGNNQVYPTSTTTGTSLDATINLGHSGGRFKDLYLSGGVYLGGTGASNLLDSYEEGTFTPTLVGTGTAGVRSGNSVSRGKYTKVGNLVHFQLYVDANSWSTAPSGFLRIGNLPFSNSSTTASENTGSVMHNAYNFSYTTLVYYMASGVNELRLYSLGDNVDWIQASIGNESMHFYITGTYATT